MDWPSLVLGALAAGGLVALVQWLQRLLGAPAPAPAPAPANEPPEALQAAREALVDEVDADVDEIRAAAASETPEADLADLLNRKLPPFPAALVADEEEQ